MNNDLFIASHARVLSLTLVTNNTAEFERVKDQWTLPARPAVYTDILRVRVRGLAVYGQRSFMGSL